MSAAVPRGRAGGVTAPLPSPPEGMSLAAGEFGGEFGGEAGPRRDRLIATLNKWEESR